MIYHYTTLQALNAILSDYRTSDDKEHLVFWASSAYAMNDSTELYYGWEILQENFVKYEEENQVETQKKLSIQMEKCATSDLSDIFFQHFYREEQIPYILSFSKNRDDLPMWSMYGGNGMGICIGIDERRLLVPKDPFIATQLLSVLYINQNDNSEETRNAMYLAMSEVYKNYLSAEHNSDLDKITAIATALPYFNAYIKNDSFKYEHEVRQPLLLPSNQAKENLFFRLSQSGNMIPYVKVPIPKECLQEIIIGPCVQPDVIKRGLESLFSICDTNVNISFSDVPYRHY